MGIIENENLNIFPDVLKDNSKELKYKYRLSPVLEICSNINLENGLPAFQYGRPPKEGGFLMENGNNVLTAKINFIFAKSIAPDDISLFRNSGQKIMYPSKVYYYHDFPIGPFKQRAELFLDLSEKAHPHFAVNRTYTFWANLRSTYYDLPGKILSDLVVATLNELGYIPIHCAAVANKESSILVWAPSDTGKTTTVYKLVSENGFKFMSEDITITDGVRAFACPYTTSGLPKGLKSKKRTLLDIIAEKMFPYTCKKPMITDYFPKDSIKPTANISHVIILARGKSQRLYCLKMMLIKCC